MLENLSWRNVAVLIAGLAIASCLMAWGIIIATDRVTELSPIFGDGLTGQAAAVMGWRSVGLAMTSIPSLNVTPRTSFGNWL